jgi:hypothetical protein
MFVIKLLRGSHAHKVGITLVITIASDAKPTVLNALIILVSALNVRTDRWICSKITLVAAWLTDTQRRRLLTVALTLINTHSFCNLSQLNGLMVINLTEL